MSTDYCKFAIFVFFMAVWLISADEKKAEIFYYSFYGSSDMSSGSPFTNMV